MNKRLSRVALVAILGLSGHTRATSLIRVATMDDLAQVWVGGATPDPLALFCRLELNKEGTGLFTMQWGDRSPALAYRVSKTSLTAGSVEFALVPIGTQASVSLGGMALPSRLDLKLGTADPKKEKVALVLQTEAAFTARLKGVTERALLERRRPK
jgi:hypothetical protein